MNKLFINNTTILFYYNWEWNEKLPKRNEPLYSIYVDKQYIIIDNKKYSIGYAGLTKNFFSSNNSIPDVKKYLNHYCVILKHINTQQKIKTFTISGIIEKIGIIRNGVSNNKPWAKQIIVIKSDLENNEKIVAFTVWKNHITNNFKIGDNVSIKFYIKNREHNNIYTDLILTKIEKYHG